MDSTAHGVNAQLKIQSTVLEMIALQGDLDSILGKLCLLVQELVPHSVCSLMLVDQSTNSLVVRSAPGIPPETRKCFDGLAMSPDSGSCGTAAYTGQMVIVEDTLTDPRWAGLRDLARKIDKLSCWSVPVFIAGEVIGTFAISRSQRGKPTTSEIELLRTAGNLVEIAITRDRADSEMREQRALLQSIIDSAQDPICAKDREGRYLLVNEAKARTCGTTAESMLGRRESEFYSESSAAEIAASDREVLASEEGQLFESTTDDPQYGRQTILVRKGPLRGAEGQIKGVLEVARDVTELKQAEEAVRHAQKLESLGVLAGGIAHDFNNLLTGILGNAELLAERIPEDDAWLRAGLRRISQATHRAAELTNQMLAYSGRAELSREVMFLPEVVKEVTTLLGSSISKKATLTFDTAPDLPNTEGDPTQLRQLVMNIVTNASEALEEKPGTIAVEMRAIDRAEIPAAAQFSDDAPRGDRYFVLTVRDSGKGMDRETLAKMFDPFFSTKFVGRGLGLAAVHGIVRGQDGAIDVQSEVGVGTRFSVYLPASDKPIDRRTAEIPIDWKGDATILLVDDEPMIIELATDVLQSANLRVIDARDGQQAVEIFAQRSNEIDLVLLDLTTPRLSGQEVCAQLRAIREDVRIVLSSGYVKEDATHEFDHAHLAGFVQKPYAPTDLLKAIRDGLA